MLSVPREKEMKNERTDIMSRNPTEIVWIEGSEAGRMSGGFKHFNVQDTQTW